MKDGLRWGLLGTLALVAIGAGYRIVAHTVADGWVETDPSRALDWVGDHPEALYRLAEQQLAAGDLAAARAMARRLEKAAPLDGRALRLQAQVAASERRPDMARPLFERAIALSPRDLPARAWLIQDALERGQYPAALEQADRILRFSPGQGTVLLPALARLSQDPAFAAVLVPALAARPPWREALLREIQSGDHPVSAERVLGGLRKAGGLTQDEHNRWVEDLMRQGDWTQAYARWASTLGSPQRLSAVFNGGFEQPISQRGFDWRVRPIPGVGVALEPVEGGNGLAAHLTFRRRPVAEAGLDQALLLAPGPQRLSLRVRADNLRTDSGLEWQVRCRKGAVLATSERLQGTFGWRRVEIALNVPPDCVGQWLRLRNPAPTGTGQYASGDLWVDDVTVTPGAG